MDHPSPDSPNQPDLDRIWPGPSVARPGTPADTPFDPRLHDLVHDLDAAWDLPVPYALAGPPNGVQPRVEFTPKPMHPAMRRFFTDGYLAFVVHAMAVTEGMSCGCDSCGRGSCRVCPPRIGGAR